VKSTRCKHTRHLHHEPAHIELPSTTPEEAQPRREAEMPLSALNPEKEVVSGRVW
jgi:hypothetical protein